MCITCLKSTYVLLFQHETCSFHVCHSRLTSLINLATRCVLGCHDSADITLEVASVEHNALSLYQHISMRMYRAHVPAGNRLTICITIRARERRLVGLYLEGAGAWPTAER